MADEEQIYQAIAEAMQRFGYSDVTAATVRDVDEGTSTEIPHGVIAMFATRQLEEARESGLLPPKP